MLCLEECLWDWLVADGVDLFLRFNFMYDVFKPVDHVNDVILSVIPLVVRTIHTSGMVCSSLEDSMLTIIHVNLG